MSWSRSCSRSYIKFIQKSGLSPAIFVYVSKNVMLINIRKYKGNILVFLYYKIIHLENSKHHTGQPKSLFLTMAAVFEPEVLCMFACMYPW